MNKTEIENKIYDLKRTIKSCENIIKANENEIKKLEAEKERPAFERVEEVADKIKFLLKLERLHDTFCPDYKPDWSDVSNAKWRVAFDHEKKSMYYVGIGLQTVKRFILTANKLLKRFTKP